MAEPLVSICIPVFNSARYVRNALESAIHQTYKNIEIIVSDNASADDTAEIVQAYAKRDTRIKFFRNETNIGSGNNFLAAFELATGHFAQALGSDDWLSRSYIEQGLKNFELHPDAAVILGDIPSFELRKETGKLSFMDDLALKSGKYSADWFFREIYRGQPPTGFISFMRREDMINALKAVMSNPFNMVQRGDRREPFDMPVFMEILSKYKYFVLDKNMAYIKTVHGRDHVGLRGDFIGNPDGPVRYALALRQAYESFYSKYSLNHFKKLRFWSGLSIAANAMRFNWRPRKEKKEKYKNAIQEFFANYSKKEKWLIAIMLPFYIGLKLGGRINEFFSIKKKFIPNQNYFLDSNFKFFV